MPGHVLHLLLSEPQRGTLADALKSLKQGVARRLIGNLPLKPSFGLGPSTCSGFRRAAQRPRKRLSQFVIG